MSTHCSVTLATKENTFQTVYCHWDGYPDHVLKILQRFYNSYEKAEALIRYGDISELAPRLRATPNRGEHTFENPQKGVCLFFYRDRLDDWESVCPRTYQTLEDMLKNESEEFNYVFKNNEWTICSEV